MSAKTPNAADAAVGHNIRIQRMAKGLSQAELGARVGVTFQQVQKYEKGVNRIGSGRLVRIARGLGVPLMALFDGVAGARRPPGESSLRLIADRKSLRLAQAFAAIRDAGVRRSLVELVERAAAPRPRRRRRSERK
jgi:transcriptional regulator with XRE-family HTH domain